MDKTLWMLEFDGRAIVKTGAKPDVQSSAMLLVFNLKHLQLCQNKTWTSCQFEIIQYTVHESNTIPSTPFSLKTVIFISIEKTKANQLQIQYTLFFFSNAISNNPTDNLQNHT